MWEKHKTPSTAMLLGEEINQSMEFEQHSRAGPGAQQNIPNIRDASWYEKHKKNNENSQHQSSIMMWETNQKIRTLTIIRVASWWCEKDHDQPWSEKQTKINLFNPLKNSKNLQTSELHHYEMKKTSPTAVRQSPTSELHHDVRWCES